jgi:hypothetical protein
MTETSRSHILRAFCILDMFRLCTTPFWVCAFPSTNISFLNIVFSLTLQDKNVTSSPYPYLTECFRNTILQWVPIGVLWLILPLWLYMLFKQQLKAQLLPISVLFITKIVSQLYRK